MSYNELIQLYFERSNAMQQYEPLRHHRWRCPRVFLSAQTTRRRYHRAGLYSIRPIRL